MTSRQEKNVFLTIALLIAFYGSSFGYPKKIVIIGAGIAGGMEAYYAYRQAKQNNVPLQITLYDKNSSCADITVCNIVPGLIFDAMLSVIPRGAEFKKKQTILFSNPGGIRVEDVPGIHESPVTEHFNREAEIDSCNETGHKQRTQDLLALGKMSMDLWQEMYRNADDEFKQILESANFNPCCEPSQKEDKILHDGYRIDLMYNLPNAHHHAEKMKRDYEAQGYKHSKLLTPEEVLAIDPFLDDFCKSHAINNVWNKDTVALWRPGGYFDAHIFLPKLYAYLQKAMGTFCNEQGQQEDCFQIKFGKKVVGLEFATDTTNKVTIEALRFEDGQTVSHEHNECHYVFCPGEAVGTLKKLGLREPAYAGFAGASLRLEIKIPDNNIEHYAKFNHCMEILQEGVVLIWQARLRNNKIFIGVAGTKAFYGDQKPTKDQAFAKNRNLLQLTVMNDVLPEFISLALGYDTKGKVLTEHDLQYLEDHAIATRWAGVRSVAYDGFPTLGYVFKENSKIENAHCATHLGSGGASFSPAIAIINRNLMNQECDAFTERIAQYGCSIRTAHK